MLKLFKKNKSSLEIEIERVIKHLEQLNPNDATYMNAVERLEVLYKCLEKQNQGRVQAETVVKVVGSIAGILTIVGFEKSHILTSKALGFVFRGRG